MTQHRFSILGWAAALGALAAVVLALAIWTLPDRIERGGLGALVLHDLGSAQLGESLNALNFDLAAVRQGKAAVPKVYVTGLPKDLPELSDVKLVKSLYLRSLLPLVLMANRELATARTRVLALLGEYGTLEALPAAQRAWVDRQLERYGAADFAALPQHIDGLPPALVLAQAIQESGWGRSRFAQAGNAQFGQRSWGQGSRRQLPRDGGPEADFGVRSFPDLMASVRGYMHNINSHPGYAELRAERARQRAAGQRHLASTALVPKLQAYSEEGAGYLERLAKVIEDNRLSDLDRAGLAALVPR